MNISNSTFNSHDLLPCLRGLISELYLAGSEDCCLFLRAEIAVFTSTSSHIVLRISEIIGYVKEFMRDE